MTDKDIEKKRALSSKLKPWHAVLLAALVGVYCVLQFSLTGKPEGKLSGDEAVPLVLPKSDK